jgi:hypothetical protein
MCPVCLATMGLYAAGGVSAGGITTYLETSLLRRRRDRDAGEAKLSAPDALSNSRVALSAFSS